MAAAGVRMARARPEAARHGRLKAVCDARTGKPCLNEDRRQGALVIGCRRCSGAPFRGLREGGWRSSAARCDTTSTGADGCRSEYPCARMALDSRVLSRRCCSILARFAFSLYSPPSEGRRLQWRLGSPDGGVAAWPVLQGFAAAGSVWALWRMLTYPFLSELWPFHVYWGVLAAWFALGALVELLDKRAARSALPSP